MAARKGSENLIPANRRSKDEARRIGAKGGIASGITRNKQKTVKALLGSMLNNKIEVDERFKELYDVFNVKTLNGKSTTMELLIASLLYKGVTGDIQAIKYIMEMTGEDPNIKIKLEELTLKRKALEKEAVDTAKLHNILKAIENIE